MSRDKTDPSPVGVQKYLKGINYPAAKQDLARKASENGAPRDVLDLLRQLPDRSYDGPDKVMEAYGKLR